MFDLQSIFGALPKRQPRPHKPPPQYRWEARFPDGTTAVVAAPSKSEARAKLKAMLPPSNDGRSSIPPHTVITKEP